MSFPRDGWRSARSRRLAGGASAAPGNRAPSRHAPPAPSRAPVATARVAAQPRGGARDGAPPSGGGLRGLIAGVTAGVEWTPVFVGVLVYLFVVVTYRIPVGDVAMGFATVALLFQRAPMRGSIVLVWFGLFVAWCFATFTQTDFPAQSWESLYALIKLWVIVLAVTNALRTRPQIRLFMIVFAVCFALYPLRGALLNAYVYRYTMSGRAVWNHIYSNPNDLAALTLLQLGVVTALLQTERPGLLRKGMVLGIGLLVFLLLMTQSRGALIALAAVALVVFATAKRRRWSTMLYVAAAAGVLAMFAPSGVWQRLSGLANVTETENLRAVDEEGSAEQRFEIWKVASAIIADHPVFGVGVGAYPFVHEQYAERPGFKRTAHGQRDTHSTALNVAAETGIPGLLLFAGLVVATLRYARRARRLCQGAMPAAAAQLRYLEYGLYAFFLAGLWGSFAGLSFLYMYLALLWVLARANLEALPTYAAARPASPAGLRGIRQVRGAWRT